VSISDLIRMDFLQLALPLRSSYGTLDRQEQHDLACDKAQAYGVLHEQTEGPTQVLSTVPLYNTQYRMQYLLTTRNANARNYLKGGGFEITSMFLELRHKKTLSFSQDCQAASVKANTVKFYSNVCAEHQKVSKTQTKKRLFLSQITCRRGYDGTEKGQSSRARSDRTL
jgi:hypothetical protein